MNAKFRNGLIAILIVGSIASYQLYNSSQRHRGGVAHLYFQTMSDEILAETRLSLSEATHSPTQMTVVAGSRTSQSMGAAESQMSWEICTPDKDATESDLNLFASDTQSKLMQTIEYRKEALRWYYPQAQINLNLSVTNSGFYHKPAVVLSLNCST